MVNAYIREAVRRLVEPLREYPFLFKAIRRIKVPPESVYRHLHFRGSFQVELVPGTTFRIRHYGNHWENALFWGGVSATPEPTSLRLWGSLAQLSRQIVDVGANTGVYSLCAAAVNPKASVLAVEPVARVSAKLRANVQLNEFPVTVCEVAASDTDGTATLYDTDSAHVYSASLDQSQLGAQATVSYEVPVRRLDTLLFEAGMQCPELIKIDVEREEYRVLRGLGALLERCQPGILIEVLDAEVGARATKMVNSLEEYRALAIDEQGYRLGFVEALGERRDRNYLLCTERHLEHLRKDLPGLTIGEW